MSLQCTRVKEEADWECGASEEWGSVREEHGAREECGSVKEEEDVETTAARVALYVGHEVKRELVLGPERLQPQDIVYTLRAAREYWDPLTRELNTEEHTSSSDTESAKVSSNETTIEADSSRRPLYSIDPAVKCTLRPCVVRLERTSQETKQQSSLLSWHKHEHLTLTTLTEGDKTPGSDSVGEQFICDICRRQFACRKNLICHIQTHTIEKPMAGRKPLADYILNAHGISHSHGSHTYKICEIVDSIDIYKPIHTASDTESAKVSSNETPVEAYSSRRPLYSINLAAKCTLRPCVVRLQRITEQQFICDTCGRQFTYKKTLIHHVQTHSEKPLASREPLADGILNTQSTSHAEKAHCCEFCEKQFTMLCNLKRHKRIHTGEKPHTCNFCKKQFSDLSSLVKHKRIHTGEKPYACDICKKQFSDSFSLKVHKRIHTGEKPYACEICKKKFTDSSGVSRHKRVHTGERPYTCNICTKQFTTSSHLIQHKRIHTGQKPHTCEICKKQFTELTNLKRHKQVHTGEKPYTCNTCTKKFARSSNLKQHKCIDPEKHYRCDYCEKPFSDLSTLKQHKCIHTVEKHYRCDYCEKQFSALSNWKQHVRIHTGEKSYACDICTKRFSRSSHLKIHKRIHTGEKHYRCVICKKNFTDLLHLKGHIRIHII